MPTYTDNSIAVCSHFVHILFFSHCVISFEYSLWTHCSLTTKRITTCFLFDTAMKCSHCFPCIWHKTSLLSPLTNTYHSVTTYEALHFHLVCSLKTPYWFSRTLANNVEHWHTTVYCDDRRCFLELNIVMHFGPYSSLEIGFIPQSQFTRGQSGILWNSKVN